MKETFLEMLAQIEQHTGMTHAHALQVSWTALILVLYLVIGFLGSLILERRLKRVDQHYIAEKTLKHTLGILLTLSLLKIWLGGVSGVLAYLGILTAALAIAMKDPLTNLAGWIFIIIRKPFTVGDRIEINGIKGDIIDIRLFQFSMMEIGNWVEAEQSSGRIVHIPNGWTFTHAQQNYTAEFDFIWDELPIIVTFESNWEKAKETLTEIVEKHAAVQSESAQKQVKHAARKYMIFYHHLTPIVWTSLDDVGVKLTLRFLCSPRQRRGTHQLIIEDMLRAFSDYDDVDLAYPTVRYFNNAREGKPDARAPLN